MPAFVVPPPMTSFRPAFGRTGRGWINPVDWADNIFETVTRTPGLTARTARGRLI